MTVGYLSENRSSVPSTFDRRVKRTDGRLATASLQRIDRPPGTAASLLMGARARDGGGRQNRGKTGLTTQENKCEKGKLRLRENRRSMDDRGTSLVQVDRRRSARPCCKSRAPRICLTAQCPSPPPRADRRARPGQAPSDHPAAPPNPGPKRPTTCGVPPESWPPRGAAY